MTASGRGARGEDGIGGAATMRGALLVAAAVAVGVVLLAKGFDGGTLPTSSRTPSEQASGNDDDEDGGDNGEDGDSSTTSTTTATTHPAPEVRVQVLNSTGPSGAAGSSSEVLAGLQYSVIAAADAGDQAIQTTAIYAAPGYEADAAAIAAALNMPTLAPQAMPTPPPPPAPADVQVVVILGADFTPPG